MSKKIIAVAGSSGFIGSHVMKLGSHEHEMRAVPRELWQSETELRTFLKECDAVIMLAGLSRSADGEMLYRTNMELVQKLADAVSNTRCRVIFGSTTHEYKDTPYHASKRDGAALLAAIPAETVTVLMPNTFGPGGKPFYNSVVSTFCCQAAHGEAMTVSPDAGEVQLIDVQTLAEKLLGLAAGNYPGRKVVLEHRFSVKVAEIAALLETFRQTSCPPDNEFTRLLRETYESYKNQAG